ncbi:RING-H2 finger protein ATL66-like [Miscanthus floridulus]|uniref:RING-H2 finger protein ATL66-like n=1 Tax=Miscanthus floridulus TaxID=154761 RepID=UPI00345AFB32
MAAQEALRWRYGDVDDGNFAARGRGVTVLVALFGALVCFVAVCLYLRWTCHRYNDRRLIAASATAPPWYSSAAPLAGATACFPVAGLDDAALAGLAVTLYRQRGGGGTGAGAADDAAQQQCCSICLGEFQEGDKVKALPRCGHGFHPECVDAWLRARASCPLCRDTLLAAAVATKPDAAVGSEAV